MCEISKSQRRTYRDQDPPRIFDSNTNDNNSPTTSSSTSSSIVVQREKEKIIANPPEFFRKNHQQQQQQQQHKQSRDEMSITTFEVARNRVDSTAVSIGRDTVRSASGGVVACVKSQETNSEDNAVKKVPSTLSLSSTPSSSSSSCITNTSSKISTTVVANGIKTNPDSCESLKNGNEMAPMMGVPPPPPPAPHMGPDGLILPRKPYNPCLFDSNHKDLRRELIFNQKIGKSVLNQKSELQRALDRRREAAMRQQAEKNREESWKDDPRTALQRALEQRARQIEQMEHPPIVVPPNPLATARAKLRTRMDSQ